MANSLGQLTVDLIARISEFTEPLQRADRQARTANDNISRSFNASELAMKAFSAAAAGLSVAAITEFTSKVIEQGNEIQKLAKLSNASTAQFQYYAAGAKTAGISLDQFADKMKDMQDRIGDFQQTGGGPMADFFNNIAPLVGVTIEQFQKLSGPQALQLFYNSLEKAGASGNDIKFYMEQIISDSSQLIPLLENGGKGFKEWGDAAAGAGAIMSDSTIKSLTEAKKQITLLDMQFDGIKNTLIAEALPVFKTVADNIDTVKAAAAAAGAVLISRLALGAAMAAVPLIQTGIFAIRAAAGLVTFAGASGAAAAGAGVLRVALAALGGPAGLAMLAVQALAAGAAFLYVKRSSEVTTPALDGKTQSIKEMTDAYNAMSAAQKKAYLFEETKKLNELSEQYNKAQIQVHTYAAGIEDVAAKSKTSKAAIAAWIGEFDSGKITAKQLADNIAGLSDVSGEYVSYLVQYATASDNAKNALTNQQQAVNSLNGASQQAITTTEQHTNAINTQAQAIANLTQKQREYVMSLDKDAKKRDYYNQLLHVQNVPVDTANALVSAHEATGTAFDKPLDPLVLNKALKDLAATTYTFTKAEQKAIALVQAKAAKYDFASIEKQKGLPAGTLSGLALQETRGNSTLVSPVGAKGMFQFMPDTAKQYKIYGRETDDLAAAQAAAEYIRRELVHFNGNLAKAFTAYHSGRGNVDKGNIGPVGRAYAPGVMRWMAGATGTTKIDPTMGAQTTEQQLKAQTDAIAAQTQAYEQQESVLAGLGTQLEQLAAKHKKTLEDYKKTFASNPHGLKKAIAEANKQYEAQKIKITAGLEAEKQARAAFETDTETQIRNRYANEARLIDANTEYDAKAKKDAKDTLNRHMIHEINALRLANAQKLAEARAYYSSESQAAMDAAALKKRVLEQDNDLSASEKELQGRFIDDQLKDELKRIALATDEKMAVYRDFYKSDIQLAKDTTSRKIAALDLDRKMTKEQRAEATASLNAQLQQQLDAITLNNEKALLDSQQYFMSETEYMQKRYELERKEIEQTAKAKNQSPELTAAQLAASRERQKREKSQKLDAAYQFVRSAVIADDEQAQLQDKMDEELSKLGDLLNQKLITYEQYEKAKAKIEERYNKQSAQLRQDQMSNQLSAFTEGMGALLGKQSALYKGMFAIEKAYAVAKAFMNANETYTSVYKSMAAIPIIGPFIAAPAAATAVGLQLARAAMIQSTDIKGFSDGGYTGAGGKYQPAGIVHAGEVVWSQDDIRRWGGIGIVESMRKSGGYADGGIVGKPIATNLLNDSRSRKAVNVNINHDPSLAVTTREDRNGDIQVSIARREARLEHQRGWRNLNDTNSMEAKQIQRNFDTRVKR